MGDECLIHVKINTDATVLSIGERHEGMTPQQWNNLLMSGGGSCYQTLAGGRGVFRVLRERLQATAVTAGSDIFRPKYEQGPLRAYAGTATARG